MYINGRFKPEQHPWEQFVTVRIVSHQIKIEQIDEEKMLLQGASSWEIWSAQNKRYNERRGEIKAQQRAEQEANKKFIRHLLENPAYAESFAGVAGKTYYFHMTEKSLDLEDIYRAAESAGISRDSVHIDSAEVIPTEDLPREYIYPKGLFMPNTYLIDFLSHSWFDVKENKAFA